MSAIRKEIIDYIDCLPDSKLEALIPLLTMLASEAVIIETNLTDDERRIIQEGREEYKKGGFIPLNNVQ